MATLPVTQTPSAEQASGRFDAVLAAAQELPFAEQARLIAALLPVVLPAIEAAHRGNGIPATAGTPESLRALIACWEADPTDDDPVWDEILQSLIGNPALATPLTRRGESPSAARCWPAGSAHHTAQHSCRERDPRMADRATIRRGYRARAGDRGL